MLFTEHDMDVVFAHADRIMVMSRGELIADGTPAEVRADPLVQEVYLGGRGRFRCAAAAARRRRRCLRSQGLHAHYGRAHILVDVSLRGRRAARSWRCSAATAPASRPRSSAIIGLVRAERAGGSRFDGRDIAGLPPYRIARLGLGYVPEERRIFPELTVRENLEVGRRPPRDGAPAWTPGAPVRACFPNLAALRERPAGRISGGEQQMLTIARTLMGNPRGILLDEPSEGLAPVIVEQMASDHPAS